MKRNKVARFSNQKKKYLKIRYVFLVFCQELLSNSVVVAKEVTM